MTVPSWRRSAGVAAACALFTATTFAVDLSGSYQLALQADPTLRSAQAALTAGREKKVQGNALLRPQIGLSAGITHLNDRASGSYQPPLSEIIPSSSSGNVTQAALQLKQPIYDVASAAEKQQLHRQTEIAEVQFQQAQQSLIQRVADAYLGVLLAQESLDVTRAEKAAVQMQRDRAQARFDVGRGKITDLHEAQARLDGVVAKEVSAASQLEQARARYQELTATPAQGLAPLQSNFVAAAPMPDDLLEWQSRGRQGSPRVRLEQQRVEIAGQEIRKSQLQARPTLDLVASYTAQGSSGSLSPAFAPDGKRSAAIGLQLAVPLYAGGAINSRQRESVAKKLQADEDLAATQRDVRLQVQDAFLSVKTGVSRIAALEQSLVSARAALEATTLGRDVGTRTELDVLDAQQRLFGAQLDLAKARNGYLLGKLELAAAVGELREGDLREIDGYLAR